MATASPADTAASPAAAAAPVGAAPAAPAQQPALTAATAAAQAPHSPAAAETQLEYLCRHTHACALRPYCFFVSWQGVLTLAYRGFPAPLVGLKAAVGEFYGGLPRESPGSKWPKTSLACLKEGARLTPAQLERLNALCRQQSGIFQAPGHKRAQSILVDSLSTLVYETRCLERVISRRKVALQQPPDLGEAPAEELARVEAVVAEADDDDYWFHASRDGNREKHYRTSALGVTLVHEMNFGAAAAGAAAPQQQPLHAAAVAPPSPAGDAGSQQQPHDAAGSEGTAVWASALPGIIARFQAAVEAELPGLYAWFDPASLHVTVRAIIV